MRYLLVPSAIVVLAAGVLAAACGTPDENPAPTRDRDAGAGDLEGINATGTGAGTGANTGLPCDVQQLLENRCIGCHLGTSPPPLLTYDNLVAPSKSDPTKSMAQVSLDRMQSTTSPMPPAPAVAPTPEEIATFKAWVDAQTPKGTACTAAPDGGAPTNTNTPTVCTSGKTWNGGNEGSGSMRPGGACITCHTMRGGPAYVIAGTVYPTAHEPNDCDGVAGTGLNVIVTDANGTVTNVPVNGVGNFYSRTKVVAPFHVKVSDGTKERAMGGALTAGDCNSCHTVTGVNGAPGRIMAP
jgi:mono/diheme cytochrome c family protein